MGVFTEHVVPVFGNVLATIMLLSPFPAVLRLRRAGKLGDINPLPYPMTVINAAGWVAYGYAVKNPYVFPANILGFLAGLFFSLTAFVCSNRKLQDLISGMLVGASGYFILLGLISCFGLDTSHASQRLWGTSAVVILMGYYFIPLSTMVVIVRTRNAASIYPPLAAAAIANGSLWTIYGLAVKDINLWLPNLFGAVIGVVQLALRMVFGARPEEAGGAEAGGGAAAGAARGEEGAAAAFALVHKASEAPPVELQVEQRGDSSSNLLIPGLEASTGPNGGGGPVGGARARYGAITNGDVAKASYPGGGASAAGAALPKLDPGLALARTLSGSLA